MISYEEYREADELELLKTGQFERYAHIQCLKICFYMQKVRQIEILQMSADFIRDDYDNVFFTYANKIQYRPCPTRKKIPGLLTQEEEENLKFRTDLFTRELRADQAAIEKDRENYVEVKMKQFMADYLEEMKNDLGIDPNIGEHQEPLDRVLEQLRPSRKAEHFVKFLENRVRIAKTAKNARNKIMSLRNSARKLAEEKATTLTSEVSQERAVRTMKTHIRIRSSQFGTQSNPTFPTSHRAAKS